MDLLEKKDLMLLKKRMLREIRKIILQVKAPNKGAFSL